MKERPIPYSPEMVRARREGRKTMTRRAFYPEVGGWKLESPDGQRNILGKITSPHPKKDRFGAFIQKESAPGFYVRDLIPCPYGGPGDRLWVREAWRTTALLDHLPPRDIPDDAPIWYEADGPAPTPQFGRYRHARFMCRWMSRGLDEITGVRVERLQDISEEDARSEGCNAPLYTHNSKGYWGPPKGHTLTSAYPSARHWFSCLWESMNGAGSWDANPWVWVVEFRRVEQ